MNKINISTILLLIFILINNTANAQSFSKNNIISDIEFESSSIMSENDIQRFLESKGSALANYQTERAWKVNTNNWSDSTIIPASQIIYEAAIDNNINPKVILTMLQKEQSLIESGNLNGVEIACGYAPGNTFYQGFGKQVWSSAWQLRQFYDNAAVGVEFIAVHDGNLPVYPENRATYALYRYNPSIGDPNDATSGQGGNYNFWLIWEQWGFNTFATVSSSLLSNGFDYPVGKPNGDGYNHVYGWDFLEWTGSVYHPGEDWNGNAGGDSDLGDPVYAVSNGEIVATGNYGTGWGNIILIQHNLPDGSTVWSNYAHLKDILVSSGMVSKGQQIGTVGKGYNDEYSAHLHFEIRKQYRLPNAWVTGMSQIQVQDFYYDPSDFIDSHRQLNTPIPISGDLNGDGIDSYGTFDPNTAGFTFNGKTVNFGTSTDLPIIGDWDHDGKDEIGVFRPDESGQSKFYLITRDWSSLSGSAGSADKTIPFGYYPTNIPIAGDWDGDGDDDIGGFYPANNNFYLYILNLASSSATSFPSHPSVPFGMSGDKPIIGDWDGDNDDDVGVFRPLNPNPNTNSFYLDLGLTGGQHELGPYPIGDAGDEPIAGDWDGDGDDNIGVYRPSTSLFYPDSSIPPNPDFTISATPSSQSVTAGDSTTYTASLTPLNEFSSSVGLSCSGLPSSATCSFSPASVVPAGSSVMTVQTVTTTPPETYTVTITGSTRNIYCDNNWFWRR